MVLLRSFINFFIVPDITFYIFHLRYKRPSKLDFEALLIYGMLIACNIPTTRLLTFIIRMLTRINIEADSSYYTVTAIIAALINAELFEAIRKIRNRSKK